MTEQQAELLGYLREYLESSVTLRASIGDLPEDTIVGQDHLLQLFGHEFVGEPLRDTDERGIPQMCWENSATLALSEPERYTYCEGYGLKASLPIPVEHAFVYDNQEERVIDATWDEPETAVYIAIPFPTDVLLAATVRNKSYAVIHSDWKGDYWLLSTGWRDLVDQDDPEALQRTLTSIREAHEKGRQRRELMNALQALRQDD